MEGRRGGDAGVVWLDRQRPGGRGARRPEALGQQLAAAAAAAVCAWLSKGGRKGGRAGWAKKAKSCCWAIKAKQAE
jgi:hypothetical protein